MEGQAPLRIVGATAYPLIAASARVRVAGFAPFLAPLGVDLEHVPTVSDSEYELLVSSAAVPRKAAILGRSALRGIAASRRDGLLMIHRLLLLTAAPGIDPPRHLDVYDLDDALFVGSAANAHRHFQWVKQEARRAQASAKRARLVLAGNAWLASQARQVARRVEVVPSCVDPSIQPLRQHVDSEVVTVGWIGSHTTCSYLQPVLPVLAAINSAGVRAKLIVVGGDTGVRNEWIEHRPWSLSRQPADLAEFDIGIMPLPDDDWTRGKSGYKLLQYFSAAVPAVASPVGVNAEIVGSDRGLEATSADEWRRALQRLISDSDERRERGVAARKYVEDNYSYQRWAPELAQMFRSLEG